MKQYKYKINGNPFEVTINEVDENNIATVEVNGTSYEVELEKPVVEEKVTIRPVAAAAPAASASAAPAAAVVGGHAIKCPLPGIILDIKVNVGDAVKKGQTVLLLEAMKMENNISADKDGVIAAINVNKGDSVMEGTDLVIIG